jgi:heme/copper-type cytochrome/quinol oxidase subunit 2
MKLLLGQGFLITLSVIILYYLFNSSSFLPFTEDNLVNWQNVIVLIFFTSVIITNLVSIIFTLINRFFLRKSIDKALFYRSMKFGIFFTMGIITVFVLNFLHILNIYYGLGILGIVIIMSFII